MAEPTRDPAQVAAEREGVQPDPMLKLTTGRMHPGWLSLLGLGIVLVLAVVFFALNEPVTSSQ